MPRGPRRQSAPGSASALKMFLVPCSCGATFAVAGNYDHQGTGWSRYLKCPSCGKRHDPKNRLLEVGYHAQGYWAVDKC